MPRADQRAPSEKRPYVERLRHAIEAGKTRDRASVPNPAVAPLGTDKEAVGTPRTAEQVAAAAQLEMAQRVFRGDDRISNAVILIAVLLTALVTVATVLWTRH